MPSTTSSTTAMTMANRSPPINGRAEAVSVFGEEGSGSRLPSCTPSPPGLRWPRMRLQLSRGRAALSLSALSHVSQCHERGMFDPGRMSGRFRAWVVPKAVGPGALGEPRTPRGGHAAEPTRR
jgi:hypothetical protein